MSRHPSCVAVKHTRKWSILRDGRGRPFAANLTVKEYLLHPTKGWKKVGRTIHAHARQGQVQHAARGGDRIETHRGEFRG